MADPFFDLGKELPQISASALQALLNDQNEGEVYERAFVPSSSLESPTIGDTIQFKDKTFKRVRFYETHFVRVVFTNCVFDECLFLAAHFEDCAFHKCIFKRCNTHKFRLTRTYIDPKAFLDHIFDSGKYPNVGVDLFHALLKNSIDESQPEFRDTAEYHFRLWQRYNETAYWRRSKGAAKWLNRKYYVAWTGSVLYQILFGYGVRIRNILLWTPALFLGVWAYNYWNWSLFGIDPEKLPTVPLPMKTAFFSIGNLSTFGTAELTPTTEVGLAAVSFQVIVGIAWIALSTAMLVKRFIR